MKTLEDSNQKDLLIQRCFAYPDIQPEEVLRQEEVASVSWPLYKRSAYESFVPQISKPCFV